MLSGTKQLSKLKMIIMQGRCLRHGVPSFELIYNTSVPAVPGLLVWSLFKTVYDYLHGKQANG